MLLADRDSKLTASVQVVAIFLKIADNLFKSLTQVTFSHLLPPAITRNNCRSSYFSMAGGQGLEPR